MNNERLACPMCGLWRTVHYGEDRVTGKPREVRFDRMDVENAPLYRVEQLHGAGKGSKEAKIETLEKRTLRELSPELKAQIQLQCERILKILKEEQTSGTSRTDKRRKGKTTRPD